MLRWITRASLLSVLACGGADAATWYVPGLANAVGKNGTHFSSDVKVLNRGSATTRLTFSLVPFSGTPPAPVTRSVAPGETFVSTNALRELWGIEGAGTLQIDADQAIQISGRTYNDADPAGTYGTALAPVPYEGLLVEGQIGSAAWVSESPDGSTGYRTNIGVFLQLPGSSADVVVFDQTGKEIGRSSVSGGPVATQLAVSAIVPGGVAVGRAEIQVTAGRAAGYAAVVDNVTGDGIAVPATQTPVVAGDQVINGVAHAPGREGTYFETDVRLLNVSDGPATVTVTPLAVAGITAPVTVSLAAGELREVKDVLAVLFKAPDGRSGSLLFSSDAPLVVLSRTSNVHPDGTPGTYGALARGRLVGRFLTSTSSGSLIGLRQTSSRPGYRTNVGFLAGPDGTSLSLTLRSRSGQVLGTNDGLSLAGYGWTQPSLDSLFSGVTIPDDSTLEVVPRSGSVDVYASVIDNATGDPVLDAAADRESYRCPLPSVASFEADPVSLAAAGTVTLGWSVLGADTVAISGVAGPQPSAGIVDVSPSATTTYRLTATGPCGTSTADVTVPVGDPSITLVSPSGSASPGQLVTLRVGNLTSASAVTGVIMTFADGVPFGVEVVPDDATGQVRFLVPILQDTAFPNGYRSGAVTLAVETAERKSGTIPFTVTPLSFPGDPIVAFRAFLDETFNGVRSRFATIRTVPGWNAAAQSTLESSVGAYEQLLRKLADDLTASPSATLAVQPPDETEPNPATATVTRGDVAVLMALVTNLRASTPQLRPAAARQPLLFSPYGTDIQVNYCLAFLNVLNLDSIVTTFLPGLLDGLSLTPFDVVIQPALQVGLQVLFGAYTTAVSLAGAPCPAMSVWLQNFISATERIDAGRDTPVVIEAYLTAISTEDALAGFLVERLKSTISGKLGAKLSDAVREKVLAALDVALQKQTEKYKRELQNVIKRSPGYSGEGPRRLVVDDADLNGEPARLSPGRYAKYLGYKNGAFSLEGLSEGLEQLIIVPQEHHFLHSIPLDALITTQVRSAFREVNYQLPIQVGDASSVSVGGISLQQYDGNGKLLDQMYVQGRTTVPQVESAPKGKPPALFIGSGNFAGSEIRGYTLDARTFKLAVASKAPPKEATFNQFVFSLVYKGGGKAVKDKGREGSVKVTGGGQESYLELKKSLDSGSKNDLFKYRFTPKLDPPVMDSFYMKASYEVLTRMRVHNTKVTPNGKAAYTYMFQGKLLGPVSGGGGSPGFSGRGPNGGSINGVSVSGGAGGGRHPLATAEAGAIYAATNGGVFSSSDGGTTWAAASVGLSDPNVRRVVPHPSRAGVVYAATNSGGIYLSTDGGGTWRGIGLPGATPNGLALDPVNSGVAYVTQRVAVQKTVDDGENWIARNSGLPTTGVTFGPIVISPADPQRLFLATTKGVFRSTDGASSWAAAAAEPACASDLSTGPGTPPVLYVAACDTSLYRSLDDGATFTKLSTCSGAGNVAPTALASGTLFVPSSPDGVCRSTDRGTTWTTITTPTAPVSRVGADPNDVTRVYLGTSDGMARSTDGGATFAVFNEGLNASSVLQVALDPSNPATLYAVRDAASSAARLLAKSTDGGETWAEVGAAVPAGQTVKRVAVDPASVVYAVSDTRVLKSVNGGASWSDSSSGIQIASPETDPLIWVGVAPSSPSRLYVAGKQTFFASTDAGASWKTAGKLPDTFGGVFAIDPATPTTVYFGGGNSRGVARSTDGGSTWATLPATSAFPRQAQGIAIGKDGTLMASFYTGSVHRSTDGGATFQTIPLSLGRSTGVIGLAFDPADARIVYAGLGYAAGGGGGLALSTDGGSTWKDQGGTFGVRTLDAAAGGATVCAATEANGVVCTAPAATGTTGLAMKERP